MARPDFRLSIVLTALAVFLLFPNAEACTRIFWNNNGRAMLVARNMDLATDDGATFYVFPKGIRKNGLAGAGSAEWTSDYGSVVVGAGTPNYSSDGINTQGLAFHCLYLYGTEYEPRDRRPGVSLGQYGEFLLDNAANVSEALDLMGQFQLVPESFYGVLWPIHIALEDASGDSAVIEFVNGQMIVYHRSTPTTVLTNEPTLDIQLQYLSYYMYFGNANGYPLPGDIDPVSRFVRASAFLLTLPKPSSLADAVSYLYSAIRCEVEPFGSVVPSPSGASPGWPTLWTSLYDLTNKMIYFDHTVPRNDFRIDMKKLDFSEGASVLRLSAEIPGLTGEVSRLLRPVPKRE
jgi:choloylglycine hydrolase